MLHRRPLGFWVCVDRHKWRVLLHRAVSAAPPSGSARFSPPHCYQASQASPHQYYTRICHPLLPRRFSPLGLCSLWFSTPSRDSFGAEQEGNPSVSHYNLPTYRPPPHRFASPDIGSRLFASARPAPRSHIGGSLFVTYVGSTSCFLSTWRFCTRSCLVGVALPSGNGGQFYFRRTAPEGRS